MARQGSRKRRSAELKEENSKESKKELKTASANITPEKSPVSKKIKGAKTKPEPELVIPAKKPQVNLEGSLDVPDFVPCTDEEKKAYNNEADKATIMWKQVSPEILSDDQYDTYIQNVKKEYKCDIEKATLILFRHDYNVEKATEEIKNASKPETRWTNYQNSIFKKAVKTYADNVKEIQSVIKTHSEESVRNHFLWNPEWANRYSEKEAKNRTEFHKKLADIIMEDDEKRREIFQTKLLILNTGKQMQDLEDFLNEKNQVAGG